MEGWLNKEGNWFRTWTRRWFTLNGSDLTYYSDESKTKKKGAYKLATDSSVNSMPNRGKYTNCFTLQAEGENGSDTLILSAETPMDRSAWIDAMENCVNNMIRLIEQEAGVDDLEGFLDDALGVPGPGPVPGPVPVVVQRPSQALPIPSSSSSSQRNIESESVVVSSSTTTSTTTATITTTTGKAPAPARPSLLSVFGAVEDPDTDTDTDNNSNSERESEKEKEKEKQRIRESTDFEKLCFISEEGEADPDAEDAKKSDNEEDDGELIVA